MLRMLQQQTYLTIDPQKSDLCVYVLLTALHLNWCCVEQILRGVSSGVQLLPPRQTPLSSKPGPEVFERFQVIEKSGATRRDRTGDLLITNQPLYQLS